jgi:hypothetical protein
MRLNKLLDVCIDDGGSSFLRNFGKHIPGHTALHHKILAMSRLRRLVAGLSLRRPEFIPNQSVWLVVHWVALRQVFLLSV